MQENLENLGKIELFGALSKNLFVFAPRFAARLQGNSSIYGALVSPSLFRQPPNDSCDHPAVLGIVVELGQRLRIKRIVGGLS